MAQAAKKRETVQPALVAGRDAAAPPAEQAQPDAPKPAAAKAPVAKPAAGKPDAPKASPAKMEPAKAEAARKPAPSAKASPKPEAQAEAAARPSRAAKPAAPSSVVSEAAVAAAVAPDAVVPAAAAPEEPASAPFPTFTPAAYAPTPAATPAEPAPVEAAKPQAEPQRIAPQPMQQRRPHPGQRMPGMSRAPGGPGQPGGFSEMRVAPLAGHTVASSTDFDVGDFVVYPTHGVGRVKNIKDDQIAGITLRLIEVEFEENRMTLRVPVAKARTSGLRKLATRSAIDEALETLRGRARVKRTMWSRRAQEYEAKINSGDPVAIAEVVRDLHRNAGQPDQSFSERQIYEQAMDRLASELAAIENIKKDEATVKLHEVLKTAA